MELEPEVFQFLVKLQRLVLLKVRITQLMHVVNIEFGSWLGPHVVPMSTVDVVCIYTVVKYLTHCDL